MAFDLGRWLIYAIVLAGVIGIAYIALKQMGITIPAWVNQILWILVIIVVAVFSIRFILSLL